MEALSKAGFRTGRVNRFIGNHIVTESYTTLRHRAASKTHRRLFTGCGNKVFVGTIDYAGCKAYKVFNILVLISCGSIHLIVRIGM
jgi:hypothetical protein